MVILGLNGLAVSILNDSEAQVEYWHKKFVGCKISPSLLTVGGHIRVLPVTLEAWTPSALCYVSCELWWFII